MATSIAELRKPAPVAASGGPFYEVLNVEELAARWRLPRTWILENTRSRCADKIPHFRLGRYVRFAYGSPELIAWLERRMVGGSSKR
jgi:hypothetical protein